MAIESEGGQGEDKVNKVPMGSQYILRFQVIVCFLTWWTDAARFPINFRVMAVEISVPAGRRGSSRVVRRRADGNGVGSVGERIGRGSGQTVVVSFTGTYTGGLARSLSICYDGSLNLMES